MDEEEATTGRGHIKGVYVLVVHDPTVDVRNIADVLTASFVVREVTTAFDALERLSGSPLACVVCMTGGTIRAEDFYTLVSRAAPEQAHRLLFVDNGEGAAFLQTSGAHWLSATSEPQEVLALVRAVAAGA